MEDVQAMKQPKVGDGRTGMYIEAVGEAAKLITDRPVFAGIIGPYYALSQSHDHHHGQLL